MACKDCGPEIWAQCDACKLVDNDERHKLTVFCNICNAYLCKRCAEDIPQRTEAAFLSAKEKIKKYYQKKKITLLNFINQKNV